MSSPADPNPVPSDFGLVSSAPLLGRSVAILCNPADEERLRGAPTAERVSFTCSPIDLIDLVAGENQPLVLLHANVFRDLDVKTASVLQDLPSRPIVAVIGSVDRMGYAFGTARQLGLSFVWPEDCLEHPRELHQWIEWILQGGPAFGIREHLADDATIQKIDLKNREDKPLAITNILNFVSSLRDDKKFLFELRLILEETINNAIFHAFRNSDGQEKYSIDNFSSIGSDESVSIEYGSDSRSIAIAITDNQGRLKRDTILEKIQRQLNTQGIFDQSGRGIYLVYSLSGRILFNLTFDKMTQLVAIFSITPNVWPESSPLRPILIFSHH